MGRQTLKYKCKTYINRVIDNWCYALFPVSWEAVFFIFVGGQLREILNVTKMISK